MPKYKYRAADRDGTRRCGILEVSDENELYEKLKEGNRYLIRARKLEEKRRYDPIKPKKLAAFLQELGMLLKAGISPVRALTVISGSDGLKEEEQEILSELLLRIRQGQPLSDAMENMEEVFPPMLISMIRAAEAAGNLDETALRMAEYYTKEYRISEKLKSAAAYPRFLAVLTAAVAVFLLQCVLPRFESLFLLMDELPIPTRILYAAMNFFHTYGFAAIIAAASGPVLLRVLLSIASVRLRVDRLKVRMPFTGNLRKIIYTARFARVVSSLYASGLPLVTAIQIAKDSIGNTYIQQQLEKSVEMVLAGKSVSESMEAVDGLAGKLVLAVRVGEETGRLETILNTMADDLEYEAELAAGRLLSFAEPAMIIVMALAVGFVMLAVMLPIYGSYAAIEASVY